MIDCITGKYQEKILTPKTWTEAVNSKNRQYWQLAADEEFCSLKETGAIKIIDRSKLSKSRTPMKCKWVFKTKYPADGTLQKCRATCTVNRFTQRS